MSEVSREDLKRVVSGLAAALRIIGLIAFGLVLAAIEIGLFWLSYQ